MSMKMNKKLSILGARGVKTTCALLMIALLGNATAAYAGHHEGKKSHKMHEGKAETNHEANKDEIMRELTYLAQKLLDMSGEGAVTVKSPSVEKAFIGVCSKLGGRGVKLTCITPESQADKNGLKTGDIVTEMNGISMKKRAEQEKHDHPYWDIVHSMKTGDVLKMDILRAGKQVKVDVTVGSIMSPAWVLEVKK